MPTSEEPVGRDSGFSYLLLLFVLALGSVTMATFGEQVRTAFQREREAELLYRGSAIRAAILSYHAVAVEGKPAFPQTLVELAEDRRGPEPKYHLRRVYLDPFTGAADWDLIRDKDGGITGVHSRSNLPTYGRHNLPVQVVLAADAAASSPPRVRDWHFTAVETAP
jgi:hypothetical protein